MKKVLVALMVLGFVSTNVFASSFAYVDLMKLFNEYSKTVDFDEALGEKQKAKEEILQKKNEEIVKLQEGLSLLKADAKKKKEEEIQKLGGELQKEYQESLAALKAERDEKMKEVLKDIEATITDYAKDNGYDFVFKKAAIAYADDANDKTEAVLDILNQ